MVAKIAILQQRQGSEPEVNKRTEIRGHDIGLGKEEEYDCEE